jgi:hypothetical protein
LLKFTGRTSRMRQRAFAERSGLFDAATAELDVIAACLDGYNKNKQLAAGGLAFTRAIPRARLRSHQLFCRSLHMRRSFILSMLACVTTLSLLSACAALKNDGKSKLGFFVTSAGPGKGADLGGLAGADKHCQALAAAAGAGDHTWRAYLSATPAAGAAVHARDRIGRGPWVNAKGVVVAGDVDQLHGANNLNKQTALTEKGEPVNGRGDTPNVHDILTGSTPDGRAMAGDKDSTCGNWTLSAEGSALVGHHDRMGLNEEPPAKSWNSSHPSRGCSQDALKATGGNGLFYCFAVD